MNSDNLAQEAITAALRGNWKKAVEINENLLQFNQNDTDALNRLSRAYAELGKLAKAKKTAQNVLKIDPFNSIAKKSLDKWKNLRKGETYSSPPSDANVFLEEPGKTKVVSLMYIGDTITIAKLDAGDEVILNHHSHRVCVNTMDGRYIGRLSDDLSARLRKLIAAGNEYQVFIKSADKKEVKVFIREVKRDKRLSDIPSFPTEKIDYVSFTPPELVHKKDEIANEAADEEE